MSDDAEDAVEFLAEGSGDNEGFGVGEPFEEGVEGVGSGEGDGATVGESCW